MSARLNTCFAREALIRVIDLRGYPTMQRCAGCGSHAHRWLCDAEWADADICTCAKPAHSHLSQQYHWDATQYNAYCLDCYAMNMANEHNMHTWLDQDQVDEIRRASAMRKMKNHEFDRR